MKFLTSTLLAFLPAVLATPAPGAGAGPEAASLSQRAVDSTCNPYTDWGHTQGTHSYFCADLGVWPSPDYNCVSYKTTDFCSGKIYCDSSNPSSCGGNSICYYGICVQKVNAKQCQRTCYD
ncbi:hypothetical protein V8F20_002899 [Naviculisporaceae sp. PSN 640]